ncbi:hypothetical protein M9H77_22464 [Catharanthus roseus]|uniref:Uncharacterized protein n=1 Tax=Catharanthus roseus TaxID=4058 RepID=A0ACC0AR98_CATRO|nr:hypothetical protein M9H77_22464 [Catharanthus roseus]
MLAEQERLRLRQQTPWEVEVHAKSNNFAFKLKMAIKNMPLVRRFSLRLQVFPLVFVKLKGKPKSSRIGNFKFFKSKFCKIFGRFRIRNGNRKSISSNPDNEGCACRNYPSTTSGSFVPLLWEWICRKNEKGILVLSRMLFSYIASIFKNFFVGRKLIIFLLVLIVSVFNCLIIMHVLL